MVSERSPTPIVVHDMVEKLISMREVIELMRDALTDLRQGRLTESVRANVHLDGQALVITPGKAISSQRDICGARVYLHHARPPQDSELTFVFSPHDGELKGIVTGAQLGEWRTGALGGLAVDLLTPPESTKLGVIGTGRQARTQVLAALAVRSFQQIAVFSPTRSHREEFARDISARSDGNVVATNSAREAVQGADVVITATNSIRPVLESSWLAADVHINHVGPKRVASCELPSDLLCGADLLVTDSIAQAQALDSEFAVAREVQAGSVQPLSGWLGEKRPPPQSGRRVYLSLGLAGTELYLAEELLSRYQSSFGR